MSHHSSSGINPAATSEFLMRVDWLELVIGGDGGCMTRLGGCETWAQIHLLGDTDGWLGRPGRH